MQSLTLCSAALPRDPSPFGLVEPLPCTDFRRPSAARTFESVEPIPRGQAPCYGGSSRGPGLPPPKENLGPKLLTSSPRRRRLPVPANLPSTRPAHRCYAWPSTIRPRHRRLTPLELQGCDSPAPDLPPGAVASPASATSDASTLDRPRPLARPRRPPRGPPGEDRARRPKTRSEGSRASGGPCDRRGRPLAPGTVPPLPWGPPHRVPCSFHRGRTLRSMAVPA